MEFEDALEKIGGFGKYQKWIFFLICWTSIPVAFHNMAYVFIAGIPDHRCASLLSANVSSVHRCFSSFSSETFPTNPKIDPVSLWREGKGAASDSLCVAKGLQYGRNFAH